jgi:hypothetical protein
MFGISTMIAPSSHALMHLGIDGGHTGFELKDFQFVGDEQG